MISRILAVHDPSDAGGAVVSWGADMSQRYQAELLVVQVVNPEPLASDSAASTVVAKELSRFVNRSVGSRGRIRVLSDSDGSRAILQLAEQENVDVIVVGSAGMRGRKQFRQESVPNRLSHNAACTLVIVDSAPPTVRRWVPATLSSPDPDDNLDSKPTAGDLLLRVFQIARITSKHGLLDLLSPAIDEDSLISKAKRLRDALEELGPTFTKLGQILSTRPDLLGTKVAEQLATLQDRVAPLGETEVVTLIEEELQMPWDDVFDSIEPTALAAGSVAQVHRARLAGGEKVVVKIRRPTAERNILRDLLLLRRLVETAVSRSRLPLIADLKAVIECLSSSLRQELDFRNEAQNIARMRSLLDSFPRLRIPAVHLNLSSKRLLVMEEVRGLRVRDAPPGVARSQAAHELLESYCEQLLSHGFFHADPHPGNLMWWNDRIYFIDFGMTGELEPDARELLRLVLLAFWKEDAVFLADVLQTLGRGTDRPDIDERAFQDHLATLIRRYRHSRFDRWRLGPLFQQLSSIAIRYGIRLPASLFMAGKAMAQLQYTITWLDPDLDPFEVVSNFLGRHLIRELRAWSDPRTLLYEGQKLKFRAEHFMRTVEGLAGARPGPNLQVDFRNSARVEGTIREVGLRLGMAVTSASAIVAAAISASSQMHWLTAGFAAIGVCLAAGFLTGRVRHAEARNGSKQT
jgi:ubiquinone biosynthesis protein